MSYKPFTKPTNRPYTDQSKLHARPSKRITHRTKTQLEYLGPRNAKPCPMTHNSRCTFSPLLSSPLLSSQSPAHLHELQKYSKSHPGTLTVQASKSVRPFGCHTQAGQSLRVRVWVAGQVNVNESRSRTRFSSSPLLMTPTLTLPLSRRPARSRSSNPVPRSNRDSAQKYM